MFSRISGSLLERDHDHVVLDVRLRDLAGLEVPPDVPGGGRPGDQGGTVERRPRRRPVGPLVGPSSANGLHVSPIPQLENQKYFISKLRSAAPVTAGSTPWRFGEWASSTGTK